MSSGNLCDLTGKTSLVTGAGSGLGRAFCLALSQHGSKVVCSDINEAWAEETADMVMKHGVKTASIRADVSKQDEVQRLFGTVDRDFGQLDVLINNAGITTSGARLHEMAIEDWNKVIAVDLTGVFLCMQEGIKLMLPRRSGSIINIASVLGLRGIDPHILSTSHYVASKHGVIGLTKSAAAQYGSDNIRVNAIAPGFIEGTRLGEARKTSNEKTQELLSRIVSATPLQRLGQPAGAERAGCSSGVRCIELYNGCYLRARRRLVRLVVCELV